MAGLDYILGAPCYFRDNKISFEKNVVLMIKRSLTNERDEKSYNILVGLMLMLARVFPTPPPPWYLCSF